MSLDIGSADWLLIMTVVAWGSVLVVLCAGWFREKMRIHRHRKLLREYRRNLQNG